MDVAGAEFKAKGGAGAEPKKNNFGSATLIWRVFEFSRLVANFGHYSCWK